MKVEGEAKRFAILMATQDSEYVKNVYGGYFNVFVAAFGEEGDRWDLFRVVDGQFPDIDEIHNYSAFVVSGSSFDAFGDDLWILRLCFLLQLLHSMHKKILGICFGHQALCRALGGKVRRSRSGWDIGLRKINFVHDLSPHMFLNVFNKISIAPPSLSIIECHQDEVWEVPVCAEIIASSDKTGVESFTIGDHVLGIQGHPEYTKDILFNLIDRLVNNNSIKMEFAEESRSSVEKAEPDRKCWQMICRSFLMGK